MEIGLGGIEAAEAAARPGIVEMDDGADEGGCFVRMDFAVGSGEVEHLPFLVRGNSGKLSATRS